MHKPNIIEINAEAREVGSKESNNLRKEMRIPGVVYGPTVEENLHVSIKEIDVKKLLSVSHIQIVRIIYDGKSYDALLKEIDFHPVTDKILHVDFYVLDEQSKVTITIPIHLVGTSIGVQNGGRLFQPLRKIRVKCMPSKLVAYFEADISKLKIGSNLHVGDLDLEGITPLMDDSRAVCIIKPPRTGSALAALDDTDGGEEARTAAEADTNGEIPKEEATTENEA